MKRRINKTIIDSGTVLYAAEEKTFFSKQWKTLPFDFGNGEVKTFLTIDELGTFFGWYIPHSENFINVDAINEELTQYYKKKTIEEHIQTPYQITKWNDPEHTRLIDVLCKGKTIQDLSDGEHTFKELNQIKQQYENQLPTDNTISKIINLWMDYRLDDNTEVNNSNSCYDFIRNNWNNNTNINE